MKQLVNAGALQMAINVLERAGKTEVVEELRKAIEPTDSDREKVRAAIAEWEACFGYPDTITERDRMETAIKNLRTLALMGNVNASQPAT